MFLEWNLPNTKYILQFPNEVCRIFAQEWIKTCIKYHNCREHNSIELRKNLSNVEKVKLFKPVDIFIDWDQGSYEWYSELKERHLHSVKWEACSLCSVSPLCTRGSGAQHLVITSPCPHHDHIDFLLLPRHWRGLVTGPTRTCPTLTSS